MFFFLIIIFFLYIYILIFMVLVSTRIDAYNRLLVSTLKLDLSVSTYGICATIFSVKHIYH
jgi:hypothetical protein